MEWGHSGDGDESDLVFDDLFYAHRSCKIIFFSFIFK